MESAMSIIVTMKDVNTFCKEHNIRMTVMIERTYDGVSLEAKLFSAMQKYRDLPRHQTKDDSQPAPLRLVGVDSNSSLEEVRGAFAAALIVAEKEKL
jgi:hypothetical protein